MANEISKLITPDGVSHDIKDSVARQASYDVSNKVSKTGDTMTGNLKLESGSNNGIIFKESGYGDKFEIKPSFSGTDDINYLALKTATGAAGTDPDTKEKIRIRPSGNVEMSGSLKFSNTSRNIEVPARSTSYVDGAKGNAGLYMPHTYNKDEWGPAVCIQTKGGGSWQIGNYNNEELQFVAFTKANIDSSTNTANGFFRLFNNGSFQADKTSVIADGSMICKSPTMPASPSSGNLYLNGLYLRDAADDDYAYLRAHSASAEKGLQLEVRRSVNGSYVYNTLNMRINASGGRIINVSDGAAWRSAIGANIALSTGDVSYTRSHASVGTEFKCWRYGNVVTIGGYFSCQATIAANTVLYSNFPKPKYIMYFTCKHEGNATMYAFNMNTSGQFKTNQQIIGGNYLITMTYVCT